MKSVKEVCLVACVETANRAFLFDVRCYAIELLGVCAYSLHSRVVNTGKKKEDEMERKVSGTKGEQKEERKHM